MQSLRLLGAPSTLVVVSALLLVGATVGLVLAPSPVTIAFGLLAAVVVWRVLHLAVLLEGDELVVRNLLRNHRFPISEVDIRARIVDPRLENYTLSPAGYADVPTMPDDNTPSAAKWYVAEFEGRRYFVDALMARRPTNHERLALELRHEIMAARDRA